MIRQSDNAFCDDWGGGAVCHCRRALIDVVVDITRGRRDAENQRR